MSGDLRTRNGATPVLMQVFGYNRNEQSDRDISLCSQGGDLNQIIFYAGGQQDFYLRILRPLRAHVVAAYLSMTLQMATSEIHPSFTLSVAHTTSEGDLTVVPNTAAEIIQHQQILKGSSVPFSTTAGQSITIDRLDLTDLLPAPGSANYRSDCFVLGIHFQTAPVSGMHLYRFQVDGSALIMR